MKRIIIIVTFGFFIFNRSYADSTNVPKVGDWIIDYTFEHVEHFSKKQVSISDFKGKWLLLDFWGEYCGSCVRSFPKINNIQKEFATELQVLLIGLPREDVKTISKLYDQNVRKHNLVMPVAYDTEFSKLLKVPGFPTIFLVDPAGLIRAITSYLEIEDIQEIMKGNSTQLYRRYLQGENRPSYGYDLSTPLIRKFAEGSLINGSITTGFIDSVPKYEITTSNNHLELLNQPLLNLYMYAYFGSFSWLSSDRERFGKVCPTPIYELKDTSIFVVDEVTEKNFFCYSSYANKTLSGGEENSEDFQDILKEDLAQSFPFDVSVEIRNMPCYLLNISEQDLNKILSKNDKFEFNWKGGYRQGFKAVFTDYYTLVANLASAHGYPLDMPIVDPQNIQAKVDVELDSIFFDDRIKELMDKYGIMVTLSTWPMQVLVFKDTK